MGPAAKRTPDAQLYVEQLSQGDPVMAQAYTLSQVFLAAPPKFEAK
jgi:hypothetical protein